MLVCVCHTRVSPACHRPVTRSGDRGCLHTRGARLLRQGPHPLHGPLLHCAQAKPRADLHWPLLHSMVHSPRHVPFSWGCMYSIAWHSSSCNCTGAFMAQGGLVSEYGCEELELLSHQAQ
jgi:hypothetical protein